MTNREEWNKYQNEYRKNHYMQLSAHLSPDIVIPFKEKLNNDGMTFADFLKTVIEIYMEMEVPDSGNNTINDEVIISKDGDEDSIEIPIPYNVLANRGKED